MAKTVRRVRSKELGQDWWRLQVRVNRKWIDVMDIEDAERADEVVGPLQRAMDDAFCDGFEKAIMTL